MMLALIPPTAAPLSGRGLLSGLRAIPQGRAPQAALAESLIRYQGARRALLAASGRTALFLILSQLKRTLAVTDPGRVAVTLPAYTCPGLAQVILAAGLELRLVDVNPTRFDYVAEDLVRATDERVLAMILVHPLGLVQPAEPAVSLARQVGAYLIEDIAQSLGAIAADGKRAGSAGDFAIGSFGPGKPVSAGGGGVLFANTSDAAELAEEAWQDLSVVSLANSTMAWGRAVAMDLVFRRTGWWLAAQLGLDRLGNSEAALGFEVHGLSSAQAALALDGMRQLAGFVDARRRNAAFLITELSDHPFLRPIQQNPTAGQASYLRLPLLAATSQAREVAFDQFRRAGVGVGKLFPKSLAELFPGQGGPYPGAEQLAQRLLTLPTHPRLTGPELDHLAVTLRNAV